MGNVKALSLVSNTRGNYLQVVCQNHKQGVRLGGPGGAIVVPIEYDKVMPLSKTFYQVTLNKKSGLYSTEAGSLVLPVEYDWVLGREMVLFASNKRLSQVNLTNAAVLHDCEYDEVKWMGDTEFLVRQGLKYGMTSFPHLSEFVIPVGYDEIRQVKTTNLCGHESVRYLVRKDQKYGLMDFLGEYQHDTAGVTYDEIRHVSDDHFLFRQGSKVSLYIESWGHFALDAEYDEIKPVAKKQYLLRKGEKYRLWTEDNLTHPLSQEFDELRRMADGSFWFRKDNQTGIYNPTGSNLEFDDD